MSTEYAIIKIGEGFAIYNQEENNVYLAPSEEQATVFPSDVAGQVEKALKDAGVKEEITLVPVALQEEPEQKADA